VSRGLGSIQRLVLAELQCQRTSESGPPFHWAGVLSLTGQIVHGRLCDVDACEGWCSFGDRVTRADVETVRRAVKRLAAVELVETRHRLVLTQSRHVLPRRERVYADDRRVADAYRRMLEARLPLSVEQREQERVHQLLRAQRLVDAVGPNARFLNLAPLLEEIA
jgi:hypothetical protein